ncbi:MAG: hypothetical protein NT061_03905 [Spirochaetes bacterium]|nr:hypothetical protein [Spirochaetota bacterium]
MIQIPEQRIDAPVIGDVVAEILHGTGEEGRYPERVHTQPVQIVQLVCDACQVADTIAVRVPETPRIDLVEDGFLPPRPEIAFGNASSWAHQYSSQKEHMPGISPAQALRRKASRML